MKERDGSDQHRCDACLPIYAVPQALGGFEEEVGPRAALPLYRLIVGSSVSLSWQRCTDPREVPLRKGARQGTVEAPQVWDILMEHTLADVVGNGIVKDTALSCRTSIPGQRPRTPSNRLMEPRSGTAPRI